MRTCKDCGLEKPLELFRRHEESYQGYRASCKVCINLKLKLRMREMKLEVYYHYSNGDIKCACCGEREVEFLSIDHINGGGNQHRKSISYGNFAEYLRKQGYPEGYRILCMNCNFAMGHFGECPHLTQARRRADDAYYADFIEPSAAITGKVF